MLLAPGHPGRGSHSLAHFFWALMMHLPYRHDIALEASSSMMQHSPEPSQDTSFLEGCSHVEQLHGYHVQALTHTTERQGLKSNILVKLTHHLYLKVCTGLRLLSVFTTGTVATVQAAVVVDEAHSPHLVTFHTYLEEPYC